MDPPNLNGFVSTALLWKKNIPKSDRFSSKTTIFQQNSYCEFIGCQCVTAKIFELILFQPLGCGKNLRTFQHTPGSNTQTTPQPTVYVSEFLVSGFLSFGGERGSLGYAKQGYVGVPLEQNLPKGELGFMAHLSSVIALFPNVGSFEFI